jgi:hypothetical protein
MCRGLITKVTSGTYAVTKSVVHGKVNLERRCARLGK